MAINLKNPQKRKGALDALRAILTSKGRSFQIDPDDLDNPPKKQDEKDNQDPGDNKQQQKNKERLSVNGLLMPKNTEVKPRDEDKNEEDKDKEEPKKETPEEKAERIKRINDPEGIERDLTDIKTDKLEKEKQELKAKKAAAKELARKASGGLLDFEDFTTDLYMAIKSQIGTAKYPEDSYNRPNPSYAGTDFLMPGQEYVEKKILPSIAVYFDQSNSWRQADIQKGTDAIACLNGFIAKRKIKKIDLYFFANNLHTDPKNINTWDVWNERGTGGFSQVVQNIQEHQYNNVIIMTDSDIDTQTYWYNIPELKLKGCVWWLFRKTTSKEGPKHVKGERGTFKYML